MKRMQHILSGLLVFGFALGVASLITGTPMVGAQEAAQKQACIGSGGQWTDADGDGEAECVKPGEESNLTAVINTIINVLLSLAGAVAVLMLIIGGIRYIVSGGDSNAIEGAKKTIMYAIIGLVVIFLSFAAVNFVIGNVT